jgi:transcriptional regulator with XRE-family HTH domain
MSAVMPGGPLGGALELGLNNPAGIRRYKTRCKVLIDSHTGVDTLELFEEVYAVDTGKTIKGPGQATVSLIPARNFLNVIFPNDYINIYFDIGDGDGWTRTFFGFVDRVEETYEVDSNGNPSTFYTLICTDFYKAFERTMIYFNPQLAGRKDFTSYDFADMNIGGLVLMSKGIVAGGTPPDVITNLILLLIGFGTQFVFPGSYKPGDTQARLRQERRRLVYGKFSPEAIQALVSVGGNYQKLRDEANAEASGTLSQYETGKFSSEEERLKALAKVLDVDPQFLENKSEEHIFRLLSDKNIKEQLTVSTTDKSLTGSTTALQNAQISMLDSTIQPKSSLSDVLDVFTFIERRSIDGFMFGQPVWQKQGSLMSILTSYSNEAVNELFFDLRPLSSAGNSGVSAYPIAGKYARVDDDARGNKEPGYPNGITYIPAVVMREYPFSTIENLDLTEVSLQLKDELNSSSFASVGPIYLGAIFNDEPNKPGRHSVIHNNINIGDIAADRADTKGVRHLDVAVISEKEVIKTTLGRSDNDHFNLFEFYSDGLLGTDQRFYMRDILPIITPIHISRNGIRVRSVTTRAARFSIEAIQQIDTKDYDDAVKESQGEEEEVPKDLPVVHGSPDLSVPVSAPGLVTLNNSNMQAKWGYRPKSDADAWIYHQGIDICRKQYDNLSPEERAFAIPIKAIADGWVVISAPDGVYDGYGNLVVIKHYFESNSGNSIGIRYSIYAHLSSRDPKVMYENDVLVATGSMKPYYRANKEAPGGSYGRQSVIPVKKDQVIGYMGNTGFKALPGWKFHLHFEIDLHFPSRYDKVTYQIPFSMYPKFQPGTEPPEPNPPPTPGYLNDFDKSGISTDTMLNAKQRSADPVKFYSAFGRDLQAEINSGFAAEEPDSEPETLVNLGDADDEETDQRPARDVQEATGISLVEDTVPTKSDRRKVDTPTSRRQILRWALLQDHWYQHNLEYLSGRVEMRGAPEIRVGYRLDMIERNMSYYVEGVSHNWRFPNNMVTSLLVTRGQPNNPFPVYVLPPLESFKVTKSQRKTANSRLATYFLTPDPVAIRRSLFLRDGKAVEIGLAGSVVGPSGVLHEFANIIDDVGAIEFDSDTLISKKYDESVRPAGSNDLLKQMESDSVTDDINEESDSPQLSHVSGTDSIGGLVPEDPLEIK